MLRKKMMIIQNASSSKKIGGVYLQTEFLSDDETDDLDFLSCKKGERIERPLLLNNILLHKRSKLTDAISCSLGPGNDMIVSPKLHAILQQSTPGPVQFFDVSFHYNNEIINNYRWMHFIYELEHLIDFSRTTYNTGLFPQLLTKPINTYEEYQTFSKKKDKWGLLRSTETALHHSFNTDLDIFSLSPLDQHIYISLPLYEKFIEQNISGLDYIEARLTFSA